MEKVRFYIAAMRLRTLPLSLAGVLLGLMLAAADYHVHWTVFLSTLLTTAFLQILSNVSNELGDSLHGTDRADREGPAYTLSRGLLSVTDFKVMIALYVLLCTASGLAMIYFSFGTLLALEPLLLMLLGVAAISGAMRYTLGRNPYGYRGLGDIYVFLFFGIVAVMGAYFVASHTLHWRMILPAASMGLFSVGVLNVNNIRDMKTDAATRVTVPLKIGERNAKAYQTALLALGWASMIWYVSMRIFDPWHYLFVLALPMFVIHLRGVWKRTGKALDPMLPLLVMSSFAFAFLAGLGFLVYLFF
ncbi:MAG: 1,4-dihydroxy-2-naphthoate octaprenyltransferase [Bacteroidales bacterium]|nr:1,4-dihydroxy-2-naphthoate octaprenyltransferase [Bacteroides sp.]MCM1197538.1 1,4-dihydroxy-2-naphthoate octaprenyltransferase [Clostridium sp.]MCM1502247.1 1,4-dihydroxy-2-naphthoate octaprenyltransferase [Bacteroidales bacterium]